VAGRWERRCAWRVSVMEPGVKRPLRRPRHRCEDNIKMYIQEMGWGHPLDWSDSGYRQVAGSCECGNEPPHSMRLGKFLH
jgi:hypothetical protein